MVLGKKIRFLSLYFLWGVFFCIPLYAQLGNVPDSIRCYVELRCNIQGLNVRLDGEKVGKTPLPLLSLRKGAHTISVEHPNRMDWLYRDWKKNYFIKAGERKIITVQFPSIYWIGSYPSGASILYDGRLVGESPLLVRLPPDSIGLLTLKKPGYEDYRINLDRLQRSMLNVHLKKTGLKEGWNRRSLRLKKQWIAVGCVAAILSGVAGYYFKKRADRAYEKYLHSGHPDEMERHFNNAVTYDKLTGVFYGLGEVSFGISLFFFIRVYRFK